MFVDPVAGNHHSVEVGLLENGQLACVAFLYLRAREVCEGGEPVIELMEELGLVEGQIAIIFKCEAVAFKDVARVLQPLLRAEEVGVVGHMEHRGEADAPRI